MNNKPRMKFTSLQIQNSLAVTLGTIFDNRGSLIRIWEENLVLKEFKLIQASIVTNPVAGTFRGLHFQSEPYSENKVIQCVSGKVFDLILDLIGLNRKMKRLNRKKKNLLLKKFKII